MRIIRILIVAAVAAVLIALPPAVRAEEPVRSGTILSGTGHTPASPWVRGMEGCEGSPTCSAWLQSGCGPALAGTEPALQTAIVDIHEVVDARPERILEVRDGAELDLGYGVALNWGYFHVQFWNDGHPSLWPYCTEIFEGQFTSSECERGDTQMRCAIRIPYYAEWMTITSSPANRQTHWTLT